MVIQLIQCVKDAGQIITMNVKLNTNSINIESAFIGNDKAFIFIFNKLIVFDLYDFNLATEEQIKQAISNILLENTNGK